MLSRPRAQEIEKKEKKSKQIFDQAFTRFDISEIRFIWSG